MMKTQWLNGGAPGPAPDSAALLAERAGLRIALADIFGDPDFRWIRAAHDAAGRTVFALALALLTGSPPAPPAAFADMLDRLHAYAVKHSRWIAVFNRAGGDGDG